MRKCIDIFISFFLFYNASKEVEAVEKMWGDQEDIPRKIKHSFTFFSSLILFMEFSLTFSYFRLHCCYQVAVVVVEVVIKLLEKLQKCLWVMLLGVIPGYPGIFCVLRLDRVQKGESCYSSGCFQLTIYCPFPATLDTPFLDPLKLYFS